MLINYFVLFDKFASPMLGNEPFDTGYKIEW